MAGLFEVPGDMRVAGHGTFNTLDVPNSTISDDQVKTGANVRSDKVCRLVSIPIEQKLGAAVAAGTWLAYIAKVAGTLTGVRVVSTTPPTTTDTVTVDVQRSTAGGAFATVMSSVVTLNSSTVARVVANGTINASLDDYIAADVFQIVVAVTGTSCQGLLVVLEFDEDGA